MSSNLGSNQLCGDLFNDDTECLIPSEGNSPNHANLQKLRNLRRFSQIPANSSQSNKILGGSLFTLPQPQLEPGVFRSLNYPAFQSLRVERVSFVIYSLMIFDLFCAAKTLLIILENL